MRPLAAIREQHVVGDAEQVRPERPGLFVPTGAFEHGDEDVLRQFLRDARIGDAPPEEPPHRIAIALEQQFARCARSAPNLVHQVVVTAHNAQRPPFSRVVSRGGGKFPGVSYQLSASSEDLCYGLYSKPVCIWTPKTSGAFATSPSTSRACRV